MYWYINLWCIFLLFLALRGVAELAKGIQYEDPIKTGLATYCVKYSWKGVTPLIIVRLFPNLPLYHFIDVLGGIHRSISYLCRKHGTTE